MFKTKWTYLVLAFVLLANLIIALLSDDNFEGEVSFELDYSSDLVFEKIMDVKNKPSYRSEVDSVVIERDNEMFPERWKEVLKQGDFDVYEMKYYKPDSIWVYETIETTRGLKGEWSYVWDQSSSTMTIKEVSTADNFFYKWVYTLVGREAVLNKLRETLINQLGEEKS